MVSELLVEICRVKNVQHHPNVDKLDIVNVKGFNCIVGRDQYKVGDKLIFIPQDAIIPQDLINKFQLEYLGKSGRVRTTKLRGYISEGLCLPMNSFDNLPSGNLAEYFGIKKYEQPAPKYYKAIKRVTKRKNNPYFDRYTKMQNIKHYDKIFTRGEEIVITEKVHGSNVRFGIMPIMTNHEKILPRIISKIKYFFNKKQEFIYGSHNVQITHNSDHKKGFYGKDVYGQIAKKYNIQQKLKDYMDEWNRRMYDAHTPKMKSIIIYGELYGKKIQDLEYGLDEHKLVIFDIKINGEYQDWDIVEDIANKLELPIVPVLYNGKYTDKRIITKYTNGQSIIAPNQIREGCVIKPIKEIKDIKIGRKILKSINIDYLLRKNGTEYN